MKQYIRKWKNLSTSNWIISFKIFIIAVTVRESECDKSPFLTNPFQHKNVQKWDFSVLSVNSVRYDACTYGEFSRANQRCESMFFKRFITQPQQICASLFSDLQECESREWGVCFPNATLRLRSGGVNIEMVNSMMMYSQAGYCNDGTLSLPSAREPINYCTSDYRLRAAKCIRKYHRLFRQNPGNPKICEEFSKARDCMFKLQDDKCQYEELIMAVQKTVRKLYRCWNPFCIWNENKNDIFQSKSDFEQDLQQLKLYSKRGIPDDCDFNTAALTSRPVPRRTKNPRDGGSVQTTSQTTTVQTTTADIVKDFEPPLFLTNKTKDSGGGVEHFRPTLSRQAIFVWILLFILLT